MSEIPRSLGPSAFVNSIESVMENSAICWEIRLNLELLANIHL